MTGVSIDEHGLTYVFICLEKYWSGCWFPWLFLFGCVIGRIFYKKKTGRIFWGYLVTLCLTVYNPLIVNLVLSVLKFNMEYYRFFWLLPVVPALAYYLVTISYLPKWTGVKVIVACTGAVLIMILGNPMDTVAVDYKFIDNPYKVPDDLEEVCAAIHQYSSKENPRVVLDLELNLYARQYDPSLRMVLSRNAVLYRSGSTSLSVDTKSDSYKRQKILMDILYYHVNFDITRFRTALMETKTDFFVVPIEYEFNDFLVESGCVECERTRERILYHFDWAAELKKEEKKNEEQAEERVVDSDVVPMEEEPVQ